MDISKVKVDFVKKSTKISRKGIKSKNILIQQQRQISYCLLTPPIVKSIKSNKPRMIMNVILCALSNVGANKIGAVAGGG